MNKFEKQIDNLLFALRREQNFSYGFENAKIEYTKPEKIRIYTPDFIINRANGSLLYIETKGYFYPAARTKMRAIKKAHPTLDIRMVFQKNLLINKRTDFTYMKWAERNNFPAAVGHIPKEWLE